MQIYIHRNNQQLGPFTEADVKAQLASGAISLQDHVWWQGLPNWIPLAQSPLAPSPLPGAPVIPGTAGVSPGIPTHVEKTSGVAIASLICGCLSLLCGLFTAIPAIILGHMGLSETRKNPTLKGRGLAMAGLIIGYGLCFISIVIIVLFIALRHRVDSTFETMNAQLNAAPSQNSPDSTDTNSNTNSSDQNSDTATTTTNSDSMTNSPDQTAPPASSTSSPDTTTTPPATNSSDSTTNSPPTNSGPVVTP